MSWSLQLQNGDLVLNGNALATVTDGNKLVQDLTCAILTPLGIDDAHPTYGSLIDSGVEDGRAATGAIGSLNNAQAATFVKSEISRICADYQQSQLARNQLDASTYGKPTLTPGETLIAVQNIQMQQVEDNLLVSVALQTGAGTTSIAIPVSS